MMEEECLRDSQGTWILLRRSRVEDDVTHEFHHSMVSLSASSDDDEDNSLPDDSSGHLDEVGQRPLTLRDVEDRLLVTED